MNGLRHVTPGNTLDSIPRDSWYKADMVTELLREHAARCRSMVDGATPLLAATFVQLAKDLDAQADQYDRDQHAGLRRPASHDDFPPLRLVAEAA